MVVVQFWGDGGTDINRLCSHPSRKNDPINTVKIFRQPYLTNDVEISDGLISCCVWRIVRNKSSFEDLEHSYAATIRIRSR